MPVWAVSACTTYGIFMATQMLAHGVAVVTVSQRLGHARASTTLNVYGHCIPGADRDAAHFISDLLRVP